MKSSHQLRYQFLHHLLLNRIMFVHFTDALTLGSTRWSAAIIEHAFEAAGPDRNRTATD